MQSKILYLSLQPPAAIHIEQSEWDFAKRCKIAGIEVGGNDAPWVAFVADLLIEAETREFVGMTFQVRDCGDWEQVNRIAERLNPEVVHYDDISTESAQRRYPEEAGEAQRLEITWAPARDLQFELAQLLNGQWFWWYALHEGVIDWNRVVAFGIYDVDKVLRNHNLTFPDVSHLPPLAVEWF